jgi:hypothetical protein
MFLGLRGAGWDGQGRTDRRSGYLFGEYALGVKSQAIASTEITTVFGQWEEKEN